MDLAPDQNLVQDHVPDQNLDQDQGPDLDLLLDQEQVPNLDQDHQQDHVHDLGLQATVTKNCIKRRTMSIYYGSYFSKRNSADETNFFNFLTTLLLHGAFS